MTCRHCKTDARHSDRTGCCSSCERLFKGLGAFDRHWTTPEPGQRACVDPLTVETASGVPVYETTDVPGGIAQTLDGALTSAGVFKEDRDRLKGQVEAVRAAIEREAAHGDAVTRCDLVAERFRTVLDGASKEAGA